ncbi:MAG: PEP-utilizing enzyme [Actinobacteria bacterium]|nr:PEP-utilizing enzyme [Actinomycetota bacterium]
MTAPYGVTQFEFNEFDLTGDKVWFCDVTHGTPPWKPLYLMYGWALYTRIQRCYERLNVPNSRGWDVRIKDGYVYVGVMLTSGQEARERAPVFREKIRPYIEDFKGLWDKEKQQLKKTYEVLRAKYGLEFYGGISAISNIDLSDLWEEYLSVHTKQWDVHMGNFIPIYYLFGLFENMARELLALDHSSPLFSKVMSGFDSSALGFNREIWDLGRLALELELAQVFTNPEDAEAVMATLRQTSAGKSWLAAYDNFLEVYGWRCERMLEWATPTWLEKPSLGIPLVRLAVISGATSSLEEKQNQAVREREEAERELLAKVPPEQRDWFAVLMKAAQNASYFSEDHTYYCDLYTSAMGRWITREIGRRFAEAGAIDDAEDVYFLIPGEISKALIPMGRVRLQSYVDVRKQEWEGYLSTTPEMLLGNPAVMAEVARRDPVISAAASVPRVREDMKADLYGSASVPGVAEGIARVVMTEHELGDLQPGEILVAPGTSAQWTPAFEIAGGVVTDGGGALSHAVIVAREYRLPAVTGTQAATRKIKTGDKVRVDGDLGLVFINQDGAR